MATKKLMSFGEFIRKPTAVTNDPMSADNIGGKWVLPDQATQLNEQSINSMVQPRTSVLPNVVSGNSNSGQLYFDLPKVPHFYKSVQLSFVLTNSHATDTLTVVPYNILQKIYFYIGGSDQVGGIRSGRSSLLTLLNYSTDEQLKNICPAIGLSASTLLSNATLAAGGSKRFYLPIACPFVEAQCPMWFSSISPYMKLDIGGNNVFQASSGGATLANLSIDNIELKINGINIHPDVLPRVTKGYLKDSFTFKCPVVNETMLSPLSAVTGQRAELTISFNGPAAFVHVVATNASAQSGDAYYNSLPISNLDLISPYNKSYTGWYDTNGIPTDYMKTVMAYPSVKSSAPSILNMYTISFSTDPVKTVETQQQLGYQKIDVGSKLVVVPATTTTSYNITTIFTIYGGFTIDFRTGDRAAFN